MILAISNFNDAHIDLVNAHLDRPITMLDLDSIVQGHEFSYRVQGGRVDVTFNDRPLDNVQAVWFRRPLRVSKDTLPVPAYLQTYSADAIDHFYALIRTRFPKALWVSDPYKIKRASDKVLQMEIAGRIGFNMPPTLVTSSETAARAFIQQHRHVVAKPLHDGIFQKDNESYIFFTTRISNDTDLSGLNLAPTIFQKAIEPKAELRVTVVGSQVYAAAVTEGTHPYLHVRDWRAAYDIDRMHITAFNLPQTIKKLCVQHVKELGLQFGALDLIKDNAGMYWFLENNPNGQWGFVERETGQAIAKAIADLLSGKQPPL